MATVTIETDPTKLAQWFALETLPPIHSVQWVQVTLGSADTRLPGPTDYYLLAVLRFTDAPTTLKPSPTNEWLYLGDYLLADWIPEAVKQQMKQDADGYLYFAGQAYVPDTLLKSPLGDGFMIQVDDYYVLYGVTL